MIIYRPYKLPTKRFDIAVRMRRMRLRSSKNIRKFKQWFKRKQRW